MHQRSGSWLLLLAAVSLSSFAISAHAQTAASPPAVFRTILESKIWRFWQKQLDTQYATVLRGITSKDQHDALYTVLTNAVVGNMADFLSQLAPCFGGIDDIPASTAREEQRQLIRNTSELFTPWQRTPPLRAPTCTQ